MDRYVDGQYKVWLKDQDFEDTEKELLKKRIVDELSFLSSLTVEEYTLFRKWKEVTGKKYQKVTQNELDRIKSNIWRPVSKDDYKKLKPVLVQTTGIKKLSREWNLLRTFTSTLVNNGTIGRSLRFLVIDELTKKYLGVICVSGDFLDLTPRDKWIGWSREIKTNQKMIGHTAIASSVIPVQSFGFSFTGGKLLALLCGSDVVENAWNKRYPQKLVGVSTTSLYGSFSMYNSLKYWNKRSHTTGSTKYEPTKETIDLVRSWLKKHHTKKYFEWYCAKRPNGQPLKRDHRQRSLQFAYRQLGIDSKSATTQHPRGVYFSALFTNTREFLRKEIDEGVLEKRYDNRVSSLVDMWKIRYASKRVRSLVKKGTYRNDMLFYDDLMKMKTWEQVKSTYLGEVGKFRKQASDDTFKKVA
jgi:hypothetical protein